MINIRKNIFETNSSSTHAICISKNNNYNIPTTLNFTFGEFGWENKFIYDTEELASYLYTGMYHRYNGDEKLIEKFKNYLYETLGKYGCECSFEEPSESKYGWMDSGYVDHAEDLDDFLNSFNKSEKRLLRYLFSPDSFIITGNDNEDDFDENVKETDFSNVEVFYKDN